MAERLFRSNWIKLRGGGRGSHELDCGPDRRFSVTLIPGSSDVRLHSGDLTDNVRQVLHEGETVEITSRTTLSCYGTAQLRIKEFEQVRGGVSS
jgi:hypothetical protein